MTLVSQGQKKIERHIDAQGINDIHIDADMIFEIFVKTEATDEISIVSGISGETFESMLLNTEVKNGSLYITTERSPYFKNIDDKLAAHKVMSIELNLIMPENQELWIDSSLASVFMQGSCKYINFNLQGGDCRLLNFHGSGTVNTKSGQIFIENPLCSIDAQSRNGRVAVPKAYRGDCELKLRSIDGDIVSGSSK